MENRVSLSLPGGGTIYVGGQSGTDLTRAGIKDAVIGTLKGSVQSEKVLAAMFDFAESLLRGVEERELLARTGISFEFGLSLSGDADLTIVSASAAAFLNVKIDVPGQLSKS